MCQNEQNKNKQEFKIYDLIQCSDLNTLTLKSDAFFDEFQKSEQTSVKLPLQWAIIKTFIMHVPTGFSNK